MMNRTFKMMLVLVDAGLLLYWGAVLLGLIPEEMRFKDYDNPVVQAWNWSFFPLDISAAVTVFLGAYLTRRGSRVGDLVLTGLQKRLQYSRMSEHIGHLMP